MKISIEEVKSVLLDKEFDPIKVDEVIKELEGLAEEVTLNEELEEETKDDDATTTDDSGPKKKWEFVIVLNDKEGLLKDKEIAGWVVQQEENADAGLIVSKLSDAAKDQNSGKKKKNKIEDLISLFEYLKPKWSKPKNIRIKTKDLTRVIIADGKLK